MKRQAGVECRFDHPRLRHPLDDIIAVVDPDLDTYWKPRSKNPIEFLQAYLVSKTACCPLQLPSSEDAAFSSEGRKQDCWQFFGLQRCKQIDLLQISLLKLQPSAT